MKSFLIIQTAFFGDVILATALVEQLADAYPDAKIDFLVQKSREVLLKNNPHIRHVYQFDKANKLRSAWQLIRTFRKNAYDHVINVHRHGTSGLITWLSGGKETIGFDAHPLSFLFDRKVRHQQLEQHEVDRNYELIRHLVTASRIRPRLYPSAKDRDKVVQTVPYVTMSPASVWYTKQWPREKWAALINCIPSSHQVFLLGGSSDAVLCESIAEMCQRDVNLLAGRLSFLESAALMEGAQMNYTNDSAPVHMASAMNAPVSAIFCSTIPAFGYGPLSDHSAVYEYGHLACRPCGIHGHQQCPEGHFTCSEINPQTVYLSSFEVSSDQVNLPGGD